MEERRLGGDRRGFPELLKNGEKLRARKRERRERSEAKKVSESVGRRNGRGSRHGRVNRHQTVKTRQRERGGASEKRVEDVLIVADASDDVLHDELCEREQLGGDNRRALRVEKRLWFNKQEKHTMLLSERIASSVVPKPSSAVKRDRSNWRR